MRRAAILAIPVVTFVLSQSANATDVATAEDSPTAIVTGDLQGTDASDDAVAEDAAAETDGEGAASSDAEPEPGEEAEDASVLPGEITADVALVSDYIFRGITNTDHNPAIQGGLTYSVDVGLPDAQPYVGFWGSNVDFNDGGEASVELDLTFGFSGTIADLDWDIGGQYYAYPGANSNLNYNYWEIPLHLSYALDDHFSLQAQYSYSPDFFANSGNAHYLLAGVRWQQPIHAVTLGVEATTGHQWIEDNATYGVDNYQDWRVAVSLTVEKITLGIAYTDTNLSKSQCFSGTNQCEPRVTFSLGASF
ncbi:TorF family putative porin [Defluviicoccus vanus]|uniref:Outer membrane beta-barrel protein n=1 Tax=Defluviicoccus vanus TaxID=111831 RepID=A0A7H1MZ08_9PROT|nr:TorF family putative porin [Defluviicoccus vanus]QNT68694.1 hypothetical protein HQ394_04080 [Defluviicoccus vanus]